MCGRHGEWRRAVELLREAAARRLRPDCYAYGAAIHACAEQPKLALELLRELQRGELEPDAMAFNSAIVACRNGGRREEAVALFAEMKASGLAPNAVSYHIALGLAGDSATARALLAEMGHFKLPSATCQAFAAAIGACARGRDLPAALELLDELRTAASAGGEEPDVLVWSAVVHACSAAEPKAPDTARELLREMRAAGVAPNTHTYSAAIAAHATPRAWEAGLELMHDMRRETGGGLQPDVMCYACALTVCDKGQQREAAQHILRQMAECGVPPDRAAYDAAIRACGRQWELALRMLREQARI